MYVSVACKNFLACAPMFVELFESDNLLSRHHELLSSRYCSSKQWHKECVTNILLLGTLVGGCSLSGGDMLIVKIACWRRRSFRLRCRVRCWRWCWYKQTERLRECKKKCSPHVFTVAYLISVWTWTRLMFHLALPPLFLSLACPVCLLAFLLPSPPLLLLVQWLSLLRHLIPNVFSPYGD